MAREGTIAQLVWPQHRVHQQHTILGTDQRQRFPGPQRDLHHRTLATLDQGITQQHIRFDARAVGLEEVRLVEVRGIDIFLGDELHDLDCLVVASGSESKSSASKITIRPSGIS